MHIYIVRWEAERLDDLAVVQRLAQELVEELEVEQINN